MKSIQEVLGEYKEDMSAVETFYNDMYSSNFETHFKDVKTLYTRMKSKARPIADDELEAILTMLPMELFAASEKLNDLRLDYEVIKLKNKQKMETARNKLIQDAATKGLSKTAQQEYTARMLSAEMVEYEVVLSAYTALIQRVESEQSFARELIMGAKKIYDSRRNSELSNPVGEVTPKSSELPEYRDESL